MEDWNEGMMERQDTPAFDRLGETNYRMPIAVLERLDVVSPCCPTFHFSNLPTFRVLWDAIDNFLKNSVPFVFSVAKNSLSYPSYPCNPW